MAKNSYEAPKVVKIKLEIKQAVLGTCNTTSNTTPGVGNPSGLSGCQTSFCFSYQ